MQRYFIDQAVEVNKSYEMDEAHVHHIKNVMRAREDDQFTVVDNRNQAYIVQVEQLEPITFQVLEEIKDEVELPVEITLYSPLLKGEKMDVVIQKSTELGVNDFIFYKAERSVVKLNDKKEAARKKRFEKIALEAAEQSRRTKVPAMQFGDALKTIDFKAFDLVLFAYEDNNLTGRSIKDVLKTNDAKTIAVVFGPEGGFSQQEAELFTAYENVHLGRRILRAETAPLYAISVIGSYYE